VIAVTRLNGEGLFINPDLIEFMEETPDTVVTLTTGRKMVVKEPAQALVEQIIQFRRQVFVNLPTCVVPQPLQV